MSDLSASPESAGLDPVHNLFQRGLTFQRQGLLAEAESLYAEVLTLHPRHAGALHLLGSLALTKGAAARGCELLAASIEVNPQVAVVHVDLGNALQTAGRSVEALQSYERALALQPGLLAAAFNRAVLLQQLERLPEALAAYERVLAIQSGFAPALYNSAVILSQLGREDDALAAYDRCLQSAPNHREALSNRGIVLLNLGRPAEALASFDQALQIDPYLAKTLNNRGNALRSLLRYTEAVESFERALALDPSFPEAYSNRADALHKLGAREAALDSIDAALRLRPDHAPSLRKRAELLIELDRYPEAAATQARLTELAPETEYATGQDLYCRRLAASWDGYAERADQVVEAVLAGQRADFPLLFLAVSDSARAQLRCASTYAKDKFPAPRRPLRPSRRNRHAKIRVGYLSGDLRQHPVSTQLAGVWERHARDRFETTAFSLRPIENTPFGKRVMAAFDQFIDVSAMEDTRVAELIREREIDILVDLMGYTIGSRTAILAMRPAPLQVGYLGFPGTMGAGFMDYVLADRFVIPDESRAQYTEKVVWLPECFQGNDERRLLPAEGPSRRQVSLPDFGLVFCCFNTPSKITPALFDVWMRVLKASPNSVLWLLADAADTERNLQHEAARRGVEARRLIFAARVGYAEHLARLPCADLFLDTFPFNAGATASDALWTGVPVLTYAGEAFAARMAGSLLHTIGAPELVTYSFEQYEATAIEIARSPQTLAMLRTRIAQGRQSAPLFDSNRFCRHLEAAYTAMHERAGRGKAPEHITVPAMRRA